ncbi:hypothetical protein [Flavobacterium sp. Root420]
MYQQRMENYNGHIYHINK